jgi:CheY-like chemotaxis protein
LEKLGEHEFDIVLMDVQMPEMDGFETTEKIRNGNCLASNINIPIIAMTAHAMTGDREMCLRSGMTDYISKPLNQQRFIEILHKYSD